MIANGLNESLRDYACPHFAQGDFLAGILQIGMTGGGAADLGHRSVRDHARRRHGGARRPGRHPGYRPARIRRYRPSPDRLQRRIGRPASRRPRILAHPRDGPAACSRRPKRQDGRGDDDPIALPRAPPIATGAESLPTSKYWRRAGGSISVPAYPMRHDSIDAVVVTRLLSYLASTIGEITDMAGPIRARACRRRKKLEQTR